MAEVAADFFERLDALLEGHEEEVFPLVTRESIEEKIHGFIWEPNLTPEDP